MLVGDDTGRVTTINEPARRTLGGGKTTWLYHDHIGYLLLSPKTAGPPQLTLDQRKTRLDRTGRGEQNENRQRAGDAADVPAVAAAPGRRGHIRLRRVPASSPAALAGFAKAPPFRVLANTPAAQAVRFEATGHGAGGLLRSRLDRRRPVGRSPSTARPC